MRYAIIENGIVQNIVLGSSPVDETWIEAGEGAEIGGTWDGKKFGPPPEPDPAEVLAAEREDALAYLAATDWLVVRSVETGEKLDDEVRRRRVEARQTASRDQERG